MRKTGLFLICVLLLGVLAGCGGNEPAAFDDANLLTVYNRQNRKSVSIGDTRADADKVTGGDEDVVEEYPDGSERASYRGAPGNSITYGSDGRVAAFTLREGKWEMAGGLKYGSPKKDVEEMFADHGQIEYTERGSMWIAYDEQLHAQKYDEAAPYTIQFSFDDGKVKSITIAKN